MPDVEPISTSFLYGLVQVKREMCTVLPSRIYKNGGQTSACGAAFSGYEWSIPMFRAKIPHFTSKIVEHSRYLPATLRIIGKWGECSTESASLIEFWAQCSIKR